VEEQAPRPFSTPSSPPPAKAAVAVVATLARPFASPAGASAPGLGGVPLLDVITPVPLSRWDRKLPAGLPSSAGLGAQFGAFLADVEAFDASAFNLSAGEALAMDPQHRLLLESAGELLAGPGQGLAARGVLGNGEGCCAAVHCAWAGVEARSLRSRAGASLLSSLIRVARPPPPPHQAASSWASPGPSTTSSAACTAPPPAPTARKAPCSASVSAAAPLASLCQVHPGPAGHHPAASRSVLLC
jgi:hypothetical protein